MKFLIVIALFAVFKADCRHFSDEPTNQVEASNIGPDLFPGGPVDSDATDEYHYNSFEPESPDFTELTQNRYNKEPVPPVAVNVNEENENALRGKGGTNILKKIIKKLESQMKNITDSNTGLQTDVNSMKSSLSSIASKMNSIEAKQGTGILRHYPYASYKKNWADAKAFCESMGGQIWTPLDKAETVAAFRACGTLCWNGWHKVGGLWVTGTGQVMNHNFWAPNEPDSGEDAVWSSETGIYARPKSNQYGWTCQM